MNAYCGPPPTPMDWVSQWNFDPFVIGGLLLLLGAGFRAQRDHPDRQRSLVMAVGVFAILFLSPLCALTTALFSARVLHHLLLVAVAAPLLALAFPARAAASAGGSFVVATMVFWAWHVPVLYTAALENTAIYWAMQVSLVVTAFLFWRATLLSGQPAQGVLSVVGAAAQMGLLGALLAFAPTPLYPPHLASTLPWGLGPLADQQLAGLLMWVPGMLPYAVVGGVLARRSWRTAAS